MTKFQARTIRRWSLVHKWTSLIATVFLLVLCVTGLPLVFHQEIDNYLNPPSSMPAVPSGTQAPTLDAIVADALKRHPGDVPVSLGFFRDRPAVVVQSAPTPRTPFNLSHRDTIDQRSGQVIDLQPEARGKLTTFLRELHTDLFLGLPGALFLGVMALMLIAAIISGVVVYAPFMRRLDFGTVRAGGGRRLAWLDLHNLLGIVTVTWLLAVGVTGAINTLHDPVAAKVRSEIVTMAKNRGGSTPMRLSSVDAAIATAREALPDGTLVSFFFPGAGFSTPQHYAVFAKGDRPITSQLFYAALIDAQTGQLSDVLEMPWYAKVLLLSQPLHFGDYGGLPLKVIWALLDVITIIVLVSGLYLWLSKWKLPRRRSVGLLSPMPGS
jgi:uncharacterized iron-regulated membrane protein